MKLASFDIFDTTLIRRCGRPEGVFELLALRLFPDDPGAREAFVHWRNSQVGALTIEEIYSDATADFPEYTSGQLIDAELEVESEMLAANSQIVAEIEARRAQGWQILFLSDMYLPSQFLQSVLSREGAFQTGDMLTVSCEAGATKAAGDLYDQIRAQLHPTEWEHWGDHPHSDVRMARRHGVKPHRVDQAYTPVEHKLMGMCRNHQDAWQYSVLAGFSRYARLSLGDDAFVRLGADYLAAAYIPFVKFIIDRCRQLDVRHLYFLSRDGYILQQIAEVLPHDGISLHYLFVSRKSLKKANPLLRKYLTDEGFAAGHCAFVDVGWYGSSRQMLNELLRSMGYPEALTFYMGVRGDVLPRRHGGFIPYFRARQLNTGRDTCLIEHYYSASPWPSTLDYRLDDADGKVRPVFAEGKEYGETQVTNGNIRPSRLIASLIARYDCFTPAVLRQWCLATLESLGTLHEDADVTPMQTLEGLEGAPLVHRLGIVEMAVMLMGKKRWDIFEPGCYRVTLGRRLGRAACRVHDAMVNVMFVWAPRFRRLWARLRR